MKKPKQFTSLKGRETKHWKTLQLFRWQVLINLNAGRSTLATRLGRQAPPCNSLFSVNMLWFFLHYHHNLYCYVLTGRVSSAKLISRWEKVKILMNTILPGSCRIFSGLYRFFKLRQQ